MLHPLLKACTSFQLERYDILIADDSTDPETLTVLEQWKNHQKIRIIHGPTREGFKGGASGPLAHSHEEIELGFTNPTNSWLAS